ncbi:CDC14A [Symbiodinium sp. KB8]|nr:CDC14A [Symbiodinium sp. KB8]
MSNKLRDGRYAGKRIVVWAGANAAQRANSACCMALYSLLYLGMTPEQAWEPFSPIRPPFPPFHDASPCVCPYKLTIPHVISAVQKARECNFFDFDTFNVEEYESFEQVENGDLSWIVQGRFCAFAGPHESRTTTPEGYVTLCPEDYIPHFKRWGVQAVVRLNKPYYAARRFTEAGIAHHHMYYLDGSNAPPSILDTFIRNCEETEGAIAVHCKAGLGRTGTCIGSYIMKHYRFTAAEVIAWLRICRPGSVIGPQQQYLESLQASMWAAGDAYRARHGLPPHGMAELRLPESLRPADDKAAGAAAAAGGAGAGAAAASAKRRADEEACDSHVTDGMAKVTVDDGYRASDRSAAAERAYDGRGGTPGRSYAQMRMAAAGASPADTPGSTRSDASQGDHLRASRAARGRGTPGAGPR